MKKPTVKILIPGIPLKTQFGGLGYCSVVLIIDGEKRILFDTGHYSVRGNILKYIKLYKINTLFLSHLHFDHCLNADLFSELNIDIYVHQKELDRLRSKKIADVYTFYFFNKIVDNKKIRAFKKSFYLSPNVLVIETPGHTSGHSSLVVNNLDKSFIIAGDALKTYKDFKSKIKNNDKTADNQVEMKKTLKYIKDNFEVIIPGHDIMIKNGKRVKSNVGFVNF